MAISICAGIVESSRAKIFRKDEMQLYFDRKKEKTKIPAVFSAEKRSPSAAFEKDLKKTKTKKNMTARLSSNTYISLRYKFNPLTNVASVKTCINIRITLPAKYFQ